MSPLTKEMRTRLNCYLTGACSLEDFQAWFSPIFHDVHKCGDSEAEALAGAVDWAFVDFESGGLTPDRLRGVLAQLAEEPQTIVFGSPIVLGGTYYTDSTSGTTSATLQLGGASVSLGRPRVLREMVPA
jgi:hypothetical protein